MMFSTSAKYIVLPTLLVCAMGFTFLRFASATEEKTKHGIDGVAQGIESLIPENIVASLLQSYSEQEQNLIQDDLKNISQMCFRGATPSTDTERVYIATAGAPGACKSTILENYIQGKPNLVYADPDARSLKYMANTYHQSLSYYNISKGISYHDLLRNGYSKWRDASNYIANSILNEAYAKGYSIAHGTTLSGPIIHLLLGKMQKKHYKIVLLLCSAPDEMRVQAVEHREKVQAFCQSSTADLLGKGKMFAERFPVYFQFADEIHMYWTQDITKWSVHAATYTKDTGLVVHDRDALKSFSQKYDDDRKGTQHPSLDELTKRIS